MTPTVRRFCNTSQATQSGSRRRAGAALWRAAEAEELPPSKTSRNLQLDAKKRPPVMRQDHDRY
jgi:hypothetical protein